VSLCWRHFRYYSSTLTFNIVSKILFHSYWGCTILKCPNCFNTAEFAP
jgi:hypothetical protein